MTHPRLDLKIVLWITLSALSGPARAAGKQPASEISQDITVRAKAAGPALAVPPPAPSKPIVDEVLGSLSLGRDGGPAAPESVHVTPDAARLLAPFPEPPFLALSPENIRALYDSWVFEVLDDDAGRVVWKTDGIGRLQERVDWDGSGPDGRLIAAAGKRYHYRFTGTRGGRSFVIESDPVELKSFARRRYAGETRLEIQLSDVFVEGKSAYATGADRWLGAMADALRAGDARADGTFRLELYMKDPRGKLAKARARSLAKKLAASLLVEPERVKIAVLPPDRAPALDALVPPSAGPTLRIR